MVGRARNLRAVVRAGAPRREVIFKGGEGGEGGEGREGAVVDIRISIIWWGHCGNPNPLASLFRNPKTCNDKLHIYGV